MVTMPDIEEKIKEAIKNISKGNPTESDRILMELKPLIASATQTQIVSVLKEVDLKPLLNHLNNYSADSDPAAILEVFSSVLQSLSSEYIISNFQEELLTGLACKCDQINQIWLNVVKKSAAKFVPPESLTDERSWESTLVVAVINLMTADIATSKYCHEILVKLARNGSLEALLFSDHLKKKINEVKKTNEIVELRIHDLMVSIACISPGSMKRVEDAGYLNSILKDVTKSDPLLSLNCIHLISDMAMSPHGLEYLKQNGTLNFVAQKILDSETDPLAELTLPGYISVFGAVGYTSPSTLAIEHKAVLQKLILSMVEYQHHPTPGLLLSVIETIGVIGQSIAGKQVLDKGANFNRDCIPQMGKMFHDSRNEVQLRTLTAVAQLLSVSEPDANGVAASITENWFNLLIPKQRGIIELLTICRQPFKEVRLSAMKIIQGLAIQYWGQKKLAAAPEFFAYLLNRSTEFDKSGKEAKFETVHILVKSPFMETAFSAEQIALLRKYHKEGPFFVDMEPTVAVEGS